MSTRQPFQIAALLLGLLCIIAAGCSRDSDESSPTTPGGIDATGTWNITYVVKTTSCDSGGQPGESANMTMTLKQEGNQLSSPEYPGSSGSINTTTGEFVLTQNALAFEITLAGVTDGATSSGVYTLKTTRQDTGAACEIIYDFTGVKISANIKAVECWSAGVLECWSARASLLPQKLRFCTPAHSALHHSITPVHLLRYCRMNSMPQGSPTYRVLPLLRSVSSNGFGKA